MKKYVRILYSVSNKSGYKNSRKDVDNMHQISKYYKFGGLTYEIFTNGDIIGPSGKLLQPRKNEDGYLVVTMGSSKIRRSTKFVHRLVAELFLPNPNGYSDVDHLDGNRANPDVSNLEWVTHEENVRRSHERGSHIEKSTGEKNPRARLTDEIVMKLREEYESGVSIDTMSKKYGYPWSTVSNAVKGITWKHLPMLY